MEAAKRAALQRLIDSGYIHTIQEMAKSITAPFWWHEDFDAKDLAANPRPIIMANGTITFVNTGEKILGVTNDHVYQGTSAIALATHRSSARSGLPRFTQSIGSSIGAQGAQVSISPSSTSPRSW